MTETELNRLRKELADSYRNFQKEYKKLDDTLKKEEGFFNRTKKRNQAIAKQNTLKELMEATNNFQKTIESGSKSTVEEQEAAYKRLKALEDKYNYKTSNVKYNLNLPLYNTLMTHHNRSVKKNYDKPVSTFLKKTAIALIPLAAIPLLPAIGLGAIGAALATPLAWTGIALAGRSVVHAIQGIARKTVVKNAQRSDKTATYDSFYPTQSNVKGFFRTYSYNRMMKRTAGNMYASLNQTKEYTGFKGTEFTPSKDRTKGTEEEDTKEKTEKPTKTEEKSTGIIEEFIEKVKNVDVTNIEEIKKLDKQVPYLITHVNSENRDLFRLTMIFLKLITLLHGKAVDADTIKMLVDLSKEDKDKSPEYNALRSLYFDKAKDLCIKLGYDKDFLKTYFGVDKPIEEKPPKGEDLPPKGEDLPPKGEDLPPKGEDLPPKGEDLPPKGEDLPPKGGETYEDSYARTPELVMLLDSLRSFDTSKMTIDNYNKANRLIAKIDAANRVHSKDFHLDNDDEMILAEVRSMADAYESKSALLKKLTVCEAAISANSFYKEAFEDCIQEFYNIVGHTTFAMSSPKKSAVVMTEFGPLYTETGSRKTAVSEATSRNLLTRDEYERVKAVLEYYKKYSTLTRTSGFADYKIQEEEYSGRRR